MNLYNEPATTNYTPALVTPEDLDVSAKICSDDKTFSDGTGISNRAKWDFAMAVFECADCTLFSHVSFEEVYELDDPLKAEAASFIADLRAQFFQRRLSQYPASLEDHNFYIRNRQWQARFAARVQLERFQRASRSVMLT